MQNHRVIHAKVFRSAVTGNEVATPIEGTLGANCDLSEAIRQSDTKFGAWVDTQAAARGVDRITILREASYRVVPAAPWDVA